MGLSQAVRQRAGHFVRPETRRSDDHRGLAPLAMTLALIALAIFLVIAGPAQAAGI